MRFALLALFFVVGCSGPAWQPGDSDLLYSSNSEGNPEVYVMPAGTSQWYNLTKSPDSENYPSWSPDGERIAFQHRTARPGSKLDIWTMNRQGRDVQPVVQGPDNEYLPSWNPDGSSLNFVWRQPDSSGTEHPSYHVVSLDDGTIRPFSGIDLHTSAGISWAPDGQSFFTTVAKGGPNADLYRFDGEQAEGVPIATGRGYKGAPSVSPDGKWVAFYNQTSPSLSTIEICRVDGRDRRVIVEDGINFYPSWSPDGKWLVYVRQADLANEKDLDIYLLPLNGSEPPRVLVDGNGRDSEPSFRPKVATN